jgi:hypothetical protein
MNSLALSVNRTQSALYRVATRNGDGTVPSVAGTASRPTVKLVAVGNRAGAHLNVQLAPGVRWTIRLLGGATNERLDLTHGGLSELSVVAGVSKITLALPPPSGVDQLSVAGGSSFFDVSLPRGTAMVIEFGGGAGIVTVNGARYTGVPAGSTFTVGDSTSANRYVVRFNAGIGEFSVGQQ